MSAIILLPHQAEFLADYKTKYLGLISGYGAGKTFSFCHKIIDMARRNPNTRGLALEPNSPLLHDILIPDFEQVLKDTHTKYTLKKTPNYNYTLHWADGSETVVMLRSMENWERLIGVNASFIGCDEIDTVREDIAEKAIQKLQGRLRAGKFRQLFMTTTPEGFRFAYKFFIKRANKEKRIIQAKTQNNVFLPQDFIESLESNYPPELLKAYLNGEFTNLNNATVYDGFSRERNLSKEVLTDEDDEIYIGQDFNVGNNCSVIGIWVDHKLHIVGEIVGAKDTPDSIRVIKNKYGGRTIHSYPDASGNNRKSNEASMTDIKLLRDAKFKIHVPNKNPFISDRVLTVNTNFLNARMETKVYINYEECPNLVEALERQPYDKNGMPDKNYEHDDLLDAFGYLVYGVLPIKIHRQKKYEKKVRDKYHQEQESDSLTA